MPVTPTPAHTPPPDPGAADEGSLIDLGAAEPSPVPEVPAPPAAPPDTEPEPPADGDAPTT